jgi:hypothetical protein
MTSKCCTGQQNSATRDPYLFFNKECVSQGISGFSRYFKIFYRTFLGFSSSNTKFFLLDEDRSIEL